MPYRRGRRRISGGVAPAPPPRRGGSRDALRRAPVERPEEGGLGDPATGILGAQLVEREVAPPAEHRLSLPDRFMKRLVLPPGQGGPGGGRPDRAGRGE